MLLNQCIIIWECLDILLKYKIKMLMFCSGYARHVFPRPVSICRWQMSWSCQSPELRTRTFSQTHLGTRLARVRTCAPARRLSIFDLVCLYTSFHLRSPLKNIFKHANLYANTLWKLNLFATWYPSGGPFAIRAADIRPDPRGYTQHERAHQICNH